MHPSIQAADLATEMAEIVRAGMPLLARSASAGLAGELVTIAADLRQGASPAAIARLPATLRGTLAAAAHGADGRSLLAAVQRFATHAREDRQITRATLAYPVIVGLLACVGIVWLATRSAPAIADLEASYAGPLRGMPAGGIVTRSLVTPVVAGLAALAAAAAGWSWHVRRRWRPAGAAAALACDARAALALVGCPADDEPRIVDEICGAAADRGPKGAPLPLVAHAMSYRDPIERAEALRAAARFYEAEADRRRAARRRLLPIAGIIAAGFFVMLYGLTLFGPLAEAMETMAVNPPGPAVRRATP